MELQPIAVPPGWTAEHDCAHFEDCWGPERNYPTTQHPSWHLCTLTLRSFFMSQAELKAALHAKIDALDGPHLALVERVLLTLEAEALSTQLDAGFDADREAGLLAPDRIETALAEARAARPYR